MAKTLKNGLSMIETNPLNHNWLDFVILSGLTLHQFQKKVLLSGFENLSGLNDLNRCDNITGLNDLNSLFGLKKSKTAYTFHTE